MDPNTVLDYLIATAAKTAAGEAVFRASNMPRVLHCPGSVQMTARARLAGTDVGGDTDYNREGTALHLMAAEAIRGERSPEEWVGRRITAGDIDPQPVEITDAHAELVEFCSGAVAERWHPGIEQHVEVRLTLAPLIPQDRMLAENRGTGDVVQLDYANAYMHVFDHKFGGGVPVPADTPQIKDYALMALVRWPHPTGWKRVDTTILQPRMPHEEDQVKTIIHDPTVLMVDFVGEILGAMGAALEPDPPLQPNPYCRWCAAKAVCPALAEQAAGVGRAAFARVPLLTAASPLPAPPKLYALPDIGNATPEDIARWLEGRPSVETFFTAVEQRAVKLMEAGIGVPGWALKRRTGNRKWRDPIDHNTAQVLREQFGVSTMTVWTQPKLKSPAQIEKLIEKSKRPLLETIVERPPGSISLVRDDGSSDTLPLKPAFAAIPDAGITATETD